MSGCSGLSATDTGRAAPLIGSLPLALLETPLDYVLADHLRLRCVTSLLRRFAEEGAAARCEADPVLAYLAHELPLHHADEERDLFPTLGRRAVPSDGLGPVISGLIEDHARSQPMVDALVVALAPGVGRIALAAPERDLMRAYAGAEHRHLAIENGIVLVIARRRLVRSDLASISRSMKTRRGVGL